MQIKRVYFLAIVALIGCTAIQQPVVTNSRGCTFYCFPVQAVTNFLVSLSASNQVTGIVKSYVPGGVLGLDATNDVVTAIFNQMICSNQPQAAITFAWFCSNRLYSVDKQLPSNSWDVDYGPLANCDDCSYSAAYLQASHCDTQAPERTPQMVAEGGKYIQVKQRR